jgi:outer membrane protein assembly factor BamB
MNRRSVLAVLGSVSLAGCSVLPGTSSEPPTLTAPEEGWTQLAGTLGRRAHETVPWSAGIGLAAVGLDTTSSVPPITDGSTAIFPQQESLVGIDLTDGTVAYDHATEGLPTLPPARCGSVVAVPTTEHLTGYELDSGEQMWRTTVETGARNRLAPAAFGEYFLVADGDSLRLLAHDTGEERWRTDFEILTGFASTTERVVATTRTETGETVVGYDLSADERAWDVTVASRPRELAVADAVYVVSEFGRLVAIEEGTVQWGLDTGVQSPAGMAVASEVAVVASQTNDSVVGVSLSTGEIVWETAIEFAQSVVTVGERAYVAGANAGIVELDVATGERTKLVEDAQFAETLTPTPEGMVVTRMTDEQTVLVVPE